MRLLKVPGADFARGNLRGDGQHRGQSLVCVEQSINEVQIPGAATTCADGQVAGQLRFGAGRERSSRSEEHTSELQSRFGISYALVCLKKSAHQREKHIGKISRSCTSPTQTEGER